MNAHMPDSSSLETPPSRAPAIIGFLFAGALILLIGFLAPGADERDDPDDVPPIALLAPASGDTVRNPVVLRFRTTSALALGSQGWTAGGLHLHARVGDVEIMPAADDIAGADSIYTWRLPPVDSGAARIHLTWAARNHADVPARTDTVHVFVR